MYQTRLEFLVGPSGAFLSILKNFHHLFTFNNYVTVSDCLIFFSNSDRSYLSNRKFDVIKQPLRGDVLCERSIYVVSQGSVIGDHI